jgi:peptide/nickel transport system permease protein
MARGDFGISYTYRVPVAELIGARLWVSLPLAIYALGLAVLIGIPLGALAASKRNTPVDFGAMGLAQIGIALPNFWFAMLLVLLFSVTLRWFSSGGFPGWDDPGAALAALTLPAVALALPQAAILARVMRSSLLDTLDEDYVRTARAKGLSRTQALWRHAFRNALIPVLTIMGLQFSFLLAGAIIIENVFYLPGLGRLAFQAISARDLIVVRSVVMILVFAVILVTFLVDIGYAAIDPRLRKGGR